MLPRAARYVWITILVCVYSFVCGIALHECVAEDALEQFLGSFTESKLARLSIQQKTASHRYSFTFRFTQQAQGQAAPPPTEFYATVETNQPTILVRTTNGLPVFYLTEGLFWGLDPAQPGTIIYRQRGKPFFRFSQTKSNSVEFQLTAYFDSDDPSEIDLNLIGILGAAYESNKRQSEFDEKSRTLSVSVTKPGAMGSKIVAVFAPSDEPHLFGIEQFTVTNELFVATVSDIRTDEAPREKIAGIGLKDLQKLGLPLRQLSSNSLPNMTLAVPEGFPKNELEKRASEKIRGLIARRSKEEVERIPKKPSRPEDQFQLGNRLFTGDGVTKDAAEAVKWWLKAAAQGHSVAYLNVGHAYHLGEGVIRNQEEALKWFRKAAEQGNANAQRNLGNAYHLGDGVPLDDVQAFKWYSMAAEQGLALAQLNVGIHYGTGDGVPKDLVQSYKWLLLASREGIWDAAKAMILVESAMTSQQIEEARKLAAAFTARSAEKSRGQ